MTKKAQAQSPNERHRLTAGWYTQNGHPVQNSVESRLQDLKDLVDALSAAEHPIWLANTARMCEAADELRVKVEALDWMLRVARHFNGPNLGILLSAIEKSLGDLEKAVESEMRACSIPSLGD
ncbi:MAG: hypothetical protein WBC04_19250 [Candidatus Acidiferrales bacterium]